MSKEYKTISLAPHLKPTEYNSQTTTTFNHVLLKYGREADELAKKADQENKMFNRKDSKDESSSSTVHVENRTPVFGGSTNESVHTNGNYGFFSAVLESYNNHWALRTCPEDWWYTIIYKISRAIDANSSNESVRNFFVSHEGKKQLTVTVGPSLYGVDFSWFLDQMTQQIADNIKVPKYVDTLKADFSTSTDCHVMCSEITVMASVQEYFEYCCYMLCGIPALEMEGTLEDWKHLKEKVNLLRNILAPIHQVMGIEDRWWNNVDKICDRLITTFEGNVDADWWSRMFSTREGFVSGGKPPTFYEGWFITEFLGLQSIDSLSNLQNGIITVPMTLTDGCTEEKSAFAAGIAGYRVFDNKESGSKWPSVKAAHGWSLMLEPNSVFREDMETWESQLTKGA